MNAALGVFVFAGLLWWMRWFYVRLGGLGFWQMAAKFPEDAYEWFVHDSAWRISTNGPPVGPEEWIGPFRHFVPRLGQVILVYGHSAQIDASQERFLARYPRQTSGPVLPLSASGLLYPLVAMLGLARTPASVPYVVGVGLVNLGYLLAAAFVFPGHFRLLRLENRPQTIVAGLLAFGVGVIIVNIVRR